MGLTVGSPFDSSDYVFELKFDGMRAVVYLSEATTVLINRNGRDITQKYPELNTLHQAVTTACVLDGEIISIENGRPSFSRLQDRMQLFNQTRINAMATLNPVQYVVFDILQINDSEIISKPLVERKKILHKIVRQSPFIVISQFVEGKGIQLFEAAKKQGLEGIVAKRKDSTYKEGVKTFDWQKIKVTHDEDFAIDDYEIDESTGKVCSLNLEGMGWCNFNLSRLTSDAIIRKFKNPRGKPVCTIQYLEKTAGGSMRMPVFKGIRED